MAAEQNVNAANKGQTVLDTFVDWTTQQNENTYCLYSMSFLDYFQNYQGIDFRKYHTQNTI